LLVYSLLVACSPSAVRISFDGGEKPVSLQVELAKTTEELKKGLMHRKTLEPGTGMLFIFPDESKHYFWMKDTLIPLDMIFMNSEKKIVGVVKDAVPGSVKLLGVDVPSRYVLEVNSGESEQFGLKAGMRANW